MDDLERALRERLVGYENVLTVEIDASGQVLIDGAPCGVLSTRARGPATLAAWPKAIQVVSRHGAPLQATVERASQGQGRWEIALTGRASLHAHLPFDQPPPRPGDLVGVFIDRHAQS